MDKSIPIAVAAGDGIGPEIMAATRRILQAAGAALAFESVELGENPWRAGCASGIPPEAWKAIRQTRILLKSPLSTPQGGGLKSVNVTLRKRLGLFANVRPCRALAPFVPTRHPGMDVVIIRENEEDVYAGIEHRQTDEVMQCLKLITRPGCERIIRYAFEYARIAGRKKVACFTKDNIMKMTDGLFHAVFREFAAEYPDIATEHLIVDIGAALLATTPEAFDVIVMPNLYGDILSDVAAQVAGSVGLAGSANIGSGVAMFEAVHGSAPSLAGLDVANPSGLLLSAVMMLAHLGESATAERIHNAWLVTIEEGIHPADIFAAGQSRQMVGTTAFGEAVIARLGRFPAELPAATYEARPNGLSAASERRPPAQKVMVGVDVFLHERNLDAETLAAKLQRAAGARFQLKMITNRGVMVWPEGFTETFCVDHWRCRFLAPEGATSHAEILALLARVAEAGLDFIKTENLCTFDGEIGYSAAQG